MKIIDYWVATYLSLFKKDERKELIASLFVLQYLWGMNITSLMCYLFSLVKCSKCIGFAGVNIISLILGILFALKIRDKLEDRYINQFNMITEYSLKIPKIVSVLVLILHILITIFLIIFGLAVVYRFTR